MASDSERLVGIKLSVAPGRGGGCVLGAGLVNVGSGGRQRVREEEGGGWHPSAKLF